MERKKRLPLAPVESAAVRAAVYDLSEAASKQLLYGIIRILSLESSLIKDQFLEILDDARRYHEMKSKPL